MITGMLWPGTYFGHWRLSRFSNHGITHSMLIEESNDRLYFASGEASYIIRWGEEIPAGLGETHMWRFVGSNHWQLVQRFNGKETTADLWVDDSDTMLIWLQGEKNRQEWWDRPQIFRRTAGRGGLVGRWESQSREEVAATDLWIEPQSSNRILLRLGDLVCLGEPNGKDYALLGGSRGVTCSMNGGPSSLEMTLKLNGKAIGNWSFTTWLFGNAVNFRGSNLLTKDSDTRVYFRSPPSTR
jgi:hypothetical protein